LSNTRWTKHCKTEEERAEAKANLLAAKPAFDILKRLLDEEIRTVTKESKAKDNYAKAGWAYLQADLLGSLRSLEKIKELLD